MRDAAAQFRPGPVAAFAVDDRATGRLAEYRRLFRLVGSRWLWFSRLVMDDAELEAIIHHPKVAFFPVVDDRAGEVGMLELDFRD